MPAATSPYQNNDYQAVSTFRPYQLPVNDIFRALSAQNQFWEQGAQRVKSAYENALDLNIVTDKNRETKDNYMKDAEKQISKLSSMDLADPNVQRQGLNIFKPLLSNENIVGEDYVVRNLNKEIANGLSFRDKDNGKEYNPQSLENIQFEKQLLRGALNREDGWKSLYGNMSTYTPYSDTSIELKKITDLVKAEEIKTAQLTPGNDWMIQEINKKGVSKERILGAIEEMGSPQLKSQMRVEGRNAYYKHLISDPDGVDGYFQGVAANLMDQKISDLTKNKAELDYQKYLIPDTKDNKVKRDAIDAAINSLDKTLVDLQTKQKPEFIANFQNLANVKNLSANVSRVEQLWQSASINNLAPRLAWESSSQELKPNNAKIAFENADIARQRLNFNYRQLAEQNRHNLVSEDNDKQGRLLEAMRIAGENGKGGPGGSSSNVAFGNNDGTSPTPEIGTDSPESKSKIGEAARTSYLDELNNQDEKVRETTISTVISPNTWARIKQNESDSRPIEQTGVLTDYDIDKASEFLNAFSNKNAGKTPLPGTGKFEATNQNDWKRWIKGTSIGAFKRMMGRIASYDNEFTSDLIVKLAQEGDPTDQNKQIDAQTRLATFRATVNDNTKFNMNNAKTLFPKQAQALGEYSKYFDNNGAVALTDANIEKAYNKSGDNLKMYYKRGLSERGAQSETLINRATYDKLKPLEGNSPFVLSARKPSLQEFTSYIRSATDPIFYEHDMQFNTQSYTHFYSGKTAEEDKFKDAQQLPNIAQYENTDNSKVKDAITFIQNHTKNITGYKATTPKAGESLPSIFYVMEGLSKEDAAIWGGIQTTIPIKPNDGSPLLQRTNNSSKFRFPGAVISYTNINNIEGGNITITNEENGTGDVDPRISAKDVYVINNGVKEALTSSQIQDMIEKKYNMPLASILKTSPEQVDLFLASLATNIELQNKKAKEKK